MLPQNSRIRRLRVALRAAEWFFISVHVFDVVFISAGFMDLKSKSDKSNSEFLSNVIVLHSINNSVLSCGYYHILFYSKCHYHIMNS